MPARGLLWLNAGKLARPVGECMYYIEFNQWFLIKSWHVTNQSPEQEEEQQEEEQEEEAEFMWNIDPGGLTAAG